MVVPVEAVGAVELFAYVFVGLGGGITAVAHQPAEWIIMVHLLYAAIGKTDGDAVVAQIVLEIVVIDGLMCGVIECNVASIDEYHTERVADVYAVACIFAPGMDLQRTVTGCAELTVGHGRGVGVCSG